MIKIGDKINNRYRLLSRVARGGMAEIYEAIDSQTKNTVALKFMLEELLNDESNRLRFNKEAKFGMKLNHINLVKVHDVGEYDKRPYIVLDFIKGQTLGEKLKLESYLTDIEICELMVQMCDALVYIHKRGVVHRDIKPDNIYCLHDGTLKLGDFGIALDLTHITKEDTKIIGSINYLAPEICRGQNITIQSDIYSLGVTFYELITHRLPFVGDDPYDVGMKIVSQDPILPSVFVPNLAKPIENIILKAMSKKINERYRDAKQMRDDLLNIISNKNKFTKKRSFFARFFGFKDE